MKSLSKQTILTVLLFAGILGCERQPAPPLDPFAKTQSDTGSSRTTEQSEQEIIEEMSKLTFEIKVGLSEKKLTIEESARLTEKIKLVESQAELLRLLNNFGTHSTDIYLKAQKARRYGQILKERGTDLKEAARVIAKNVSMRLQKEYFSNLRTNKKPDCAGLCSQQFNIDDENCENSFVMELGVSLFMGELSDLLSSVGYIFAISMYNNCENAAFSSHSTCIDNCFI